MLPVLGGGQSTSISSKMLNMARLSSKASKSVGHWSKTSYELKHILMLKNDYITVFILQYLFVIDIVDDIVNDIINDIVNDIVNNIEDGIVTNFMTL